MLFVFWIKVFFRINGFETFNKTDSRLGFLFKKKKFLHQLVCRLLCNAATQSHFDYVCSSWYLILGKRLNSSFEILENKFTQFCLHLNNRAYISSIDFAKINLLPVNDHFEQCIGSITIKCFRSISPSFMNDVFEAASQH